ncbi:MAG: hypothetical protein DRH76_10760 [Deltaproteobacteria bacterium]|nr:MAG: hypothetical protein DRH76_10760 [Deltaproteobacteria bacterium]
MQICRHYYGSMKRIFLLHWVAGQKHQRQQTMKQQQSDSSPGNIQTPNQAEYSEEQEMLDSKDLKANLAFLKKLKSKTT